MVSPCMTAEQFAEVPEQLTLRDGLHPRGPASTVLYLPMYYLPLTKLERTLTSSWDWISEVLCEWISIPCDPPYPLPDNSYRVSSPLRCREPLPCHSGASSPPILPGGMANPLALDIKSDYLFLFEAESAGSSGADSSGAGFGCQRSCNAGMFLLCVRITTSSPMRNVVSSSACENLPSR